MRLLGWLTLFVWLCGCTGTATTSSRKEKEENAEQPANVAGGLGLVMQCNVLNRESPNATSSEIGCMVSNNDGSRYTGSMDDMTAAITANGRALPIKVIPNRVAGGGSIDISVRVDGLRPADAQSIEINGRFDKKPATLTATLKGRFAMICDDDVTYHVLQEAPEGNLGCTQGAPCSTIAKAVALLPDIFNCKVTVKIAGGEYEGVKRTYREAVSVSGRQVTDKGGLKIVGVAFKDGKFGNQTDDLDGFNAPVIAPPADLAAAFDPFTGQKSNRSAVSIRSFGRDGSFLEIAGISIDGSGAIEYGLRLETTVALIHRVRIQDVKNTAVGITSSSRVHLADLSVSGSPSGVDAADSFPLTVSKRFVMAGQGEDKAGFGIRVTRAEFSTFSETTAAGNPIPPSLLVSNVETGMELIQADTKFDQLSDIRIEKVKTGIHSTAFSNLKWEQGEALSGDIQPLLSLTDCRINCLDIKASNVDLKSRPEPNYGPPETLKKRLRLELKVVSDKSPEEPNEAKLISLAANSKLSVAFMENLWCPSDVAVFIEGNSQYNHVILHGNDLEHQCKRSLGYYKFASEIVPGGALDIFSAAADGTLTPQPSTQIKDIFRKPDFGNYGNIFASKFGGGFIPIATWFMNIGNPPKFNGQDTQILRNFQPPSGTRRFLIVAAPASDNTGDFPVEAFGRFDSLSDPDAIITLDDMSHRQSVYYEEPSIERWDGNYVDLTDGNEFHTFTLRQFDSVTEVKINDVVAPFFGAANHIVRWKVRPPDSDETNDLQSLSQAIPGDVAITTNTDPKQLWIFKGADPSNIDHWSLLAPHEKPRSNNGRLKVYVQLPTVEPGANDDGGYVDLKVTGQPVSATPRSDVTFTCTDCIWME